MVVSGSAAIAAGRLQVGQPRACFADRHGRVLLLDAHVEGVEGNPETRRVDRLDDLESLIDGIDQARLEAIERFHARARCPARRRLRQGAGGSRRAAQSSRGVPRHRAATCDRPRNRLGRRRRGRPRGRQRRCSHGGSHLWPRQSTDRPRGDRGSPASRRRSLRRVRDRREGLGPRRGPSRPAARLAAQRRQTPSQQFAAQASRGDRRSAARPRSRYWRRADSSARWFPSDHQWEWWWRGRLLAPAW